MIDLYLKIARDTRAVFERDAKLWITRHPSRREPPDPVKKSIEELTQEREKVVAIVEMFTKAGPYSNSRTESIRQALETLVKKWALFLERLIQYLDSQEDVEYRETRLNWTILHINRMRRQVVQLFAAKG
jgi:hypothetical protein